MKTGKIISWVVGIIVLAGVAWGVYAIATSPKIAEGDIINRTGELHWHAHLSIVVDGKPVEIPTDIGVNGPMGAGGDPMALHTHDTSGIIHAEFFGMVTKDQLRLKEFFKIWGKDFSKDSIMGHTATDGHTITMTVNGEPNTDFENYAITGQGTYDSGGDLGKVDDIVITYK